MSPSQISKLIPPLAFLGSMTTFWMMKKDLTNANWIYSKVVQDHFFHPKNLLRDEKPEKFDGIGEVGSMACGDIMKIWIKVKNDRIIDCKWKTFGCASAIASTSMLSEIVTEKGGMKLDTALKLKPSDIVKRLGGLPNQKIHCSVLGDQALSAAIKDFFEKTKQLPRAKKIKMRDQSHSHEITPCAFPADLPRRNAVKRDEIICACKKIKESALHRAYEKGATTLAKIEKVTGAGTVCGACKPVIQKLIRTWKK